MPDFVEIFRRIPLLASLNPQAFSITPLCGFTNFNYHLRHGHHDYVLRIPRNPDSQLIERRIEAFNEDQVVRKGFAPEVIWREESGMSLTRCIRHSRSLTESDLVDECTAVLLIERIKTLHRSDIRFKGQTDVMMLLKYYAGLPLQGRNHIGNERLNNAQRIHQSIHKDDNRVVSSHNDLVLHNILIDDQQKLWLIDWEYSARSSPYWDLATVCNSARLDQPGIENLLGLYGSAKDKLKLDYLRGYQYLLQLLTIGWFATCPGAAVAKELDWLHYLEKSVAKSFKS